MSLDHIISHTKFALIQLYALVHVQYLYVQTWYGTETVKCKGVTWMNLLYTHVCVKEGDSCRKNETE